MKARFDKPPTTWDEVLAAYPAEIGARTRKLRDIVVAALPQATETVQGAKMMGYAFYWLDDRNDVLAMVGPEDAHVKLYIHHVTKDATGTLNVEGTGKHARHVKFFDDPEPSAVHALLQQVVAARD